ncbi:MAG: hypothetical protein IEMM0002_0271 [bacterium]|nr:MAG: hypothetical protein IEMM0002_0271 [bacterium]
MKKKILGVSFLYGRFKAVSIEKWGVGKSWEAPFMVKEANDMKEALATAVESTKYTGRDVTFVIEDKLLDHQFQKVPPMKQKDLSLYLSRKVAQEKKFEGEAIYSYSRTVSPKGGEVVSVNVLPKSFLDGIVTACRTLDLNIVRMVPMSVVLAQQIRNLSINDNEMAAVMTETGEKLPLVIGKTDGSMMLDRYLSRDVDGGKDASRISGEINRSIVFSKQQFGEKVSMLRLMGRFAESFVESLREKLEIPVECIRDTDHIFWIQESMKISLGDESNMVSAEIRKSFSKRRTYKIAAFLVFAFWVAAIILAGVMEVIILRGEHKLKWTRKQVVELKIKKAEWDKRYAELERLRRSVRMIDEDRIEPLSGWFIGYLGSTLPIGLVLTKARVFQDGSEWKLEIEGNSNIGLENTAKELKVFETKLTNGPYKVFITGNWHKDWLEHLQKGMIRPKDRKPFSIDGGIR